MSSKLYSYAVWCESDNGGACLQYILWWVSKMTGLEQTVFLACLLATHFGPVELVESDGGCPSPQYAKIGQEGVLECSVPLTFKGVVWYNSTNTTNSLVARIERQLDGSLRISGEGVKTGIYNIARNGSLIIPEVTAQHDRNFTVLILNEKYDTSSFTVELITLVYSRQRFPAVNSLEANLVFLEPVTRYASLSCSFQKVRPAVTLSWFKFNNGKFEHFEATQYISSEDGLSFSSASNITIHNLTYNSLHLFSCRAFGPAVGVKEARTDALVVAENRKMERYRKCHSEKRKETVFADSAIEIPCTVDRPPYAFIWQLSETNRSHILALSVKGMIRLLNEMNTTMDVSEDGSLIFPHVDRNMTGMYTCFFLMDDISSCTNVELQVKAPVRIKTEENTKAASPSTWVIIPFVLMAAVALLTFDYALDRHRQRKLTEIIKAILNIRIKDSEIFEKGVTNKLRTVSKDKEENRESSTVGVIKAIKPIATKATAFVNLSPDVSAGQEVASEAGEAVGAEQTIGYSLEKLVEDQDRVNLVKPALEAFISIQIDLAEIVVLLSIAHKEAGSKIWRPWLAWKALKRSKSFLQDIEAMQSGEKESFDQILSKIKIKANDLANIAFGREFVTENVTSPQNISQWESVFQENPRKSFDYLEEAVKTILQKQKDLNGTPTLLNFAKQLYGSLPDSTAVDRSTEDNTHAPNNLSGDGSNVGTNVSKIAKGVSAAGVVLSEIGVPVDLEFLSKAACNTLREEREQFSQALCDASDIMEKINNIVSQMHSAEYSSV